MISPIDFLKSLDPNGWHNLVAIKPGAVRGVDYPVGVTIAPGEWAKAETFIEKWNGVHNLYFSVNEPRPHAPNKKLDKDDIAHIRAIYSDVDPQEGNLAERRQEIVDRANKTFIACKPGRIIDSGGGYQFFWPLAEKLDARVAAKQAEDQARGIAHLIGGDGVGNIDRIMRLPGTWNIPGPDKIAKGRVKAMADLVKDTSAVFTLDTLSKAYKPSEAEETEDKRAEIRELQRSLDWTYITGGSTYADLPADLRFAFEDLLANNAHAAGVWSGTIEPKDTTSSGWRFELARILSNQSELTADQYGALVWVWDKADPDKIDKRAIARDWINAQETGRPEPDPALFIEDFGPEPEKPKLPAKTYNFEHFDDIAAELIVGAPALIDGLLDKGAMSVTYGDSNAGKTFVVMDMAYHIATGRPYAGMDVQQGLVVYVAAEGGMGAKKRIVALKQRYPTITPEFLLLASPVDLRRPDADMVPLTKALKAINLPIAFLVIDTLSRAMAGGDENSPVDMGAIVSNVDLIRKAIDPVHVMFIHHTGKDKAKGARGHSLLRAATDTEIEVEAIDGASPAAGTIKVTKQRDMDGSWSQGFRLRVHTIGIKDNGKPVTSCTVDLVGFDEAKAAGAKLTVKEREVLTALEGLQAEREGAIAVGAVASRLMDNPSKSDVSTTRSHLRNLEVKGYTVKIEGGKWLKKVVEGASTTLPFDNLSGLKVVESGREVVDKLFD